MHTIFENRPGHRRCVSLKTTGFQLAKALSAVTLSHVDVAVHIAAELLAAARKREDVPPSFDSMVTYTTHRSDMI